MESKLLYLVPQIEIIRLPEPLMLDLPVSNAEVDDEAAKQSINDDDWIDESSSAFHD